MDTKRCIVQNFISTELIEADVTLAIAPEPAGGAFALAKAYLDVPADSFVHVFATGKSPGNVKIQRECDKALKTSRPPTELGQFEDVHFGFVVGGKLALDII